ncbi:TonB-dependent receptor [Acetobacteraceae bacterium KSS12]|uniref:TonB-dependent receptor n=1 Tax=Rhizosaccharibacter radicis TaxID=2782605 RepID=A0ABT1VY00_9PROT|nr:TonB-dependent receptor [Acetobacteraceae bacterium KSS12]
MIVTGTRSLNRKARDSTSPIDVISAATLRRSGQPNLVDQITRTDPSVTIKAYGADTAALVAAIRLRGLSPNQVLVLVDGKRRHPTSNITADAGPEQGSTPVDINMIPAAAIDHIEILRDGAAAQYGSDAIAGVVNIIMKKTDHGGSGTAFTGADAYNGDGWQYQLDADQGFSFGDDGYVHVGGQIYHTDFFVTNATDHRAAANGFPPNSNKINGLPEETRETLSVEFGKTLVPDLWGGLRGYGLVTYGHRHSEAYENYRIPSRLPQYYPYGFSPRETNEENDYAATLGLKADDFFGFHADLSTTWGSDNTKIGNKNTGNPGLVQYGAPQYGYAVGFTPTTVLAQSQSTDQWTNNLDFTRPFTAFHMPMNFAIGAEERSEVYVLGAGSPASTLYGGTQGFAGLLPANAGRFSRNVWAGYIDYDVHPLPHWDVDFAGRFEHYTDAGDTENGKISTRYDFTKWLALRGTISNGFRAPTLAEENYSSLNVSPTGASGILATSSGGARSIGAVPLKGERSTNASAGIVLQPLSNLSITTDIYQINIRDRIVGAGGVTGYPALAAIESTGATVPADVAENPDLVKDVSAYYFANGASTRTQGIDINANYFTDFRYRGLGTVTWTAGIDLNRTRIHHVGIDANGNPFLNEQGIGWLTTASPRSKIILNAFWKYGKLDVNVRQTRYGQTKSNLTYQDAAPADLQYSGTQFAEFKNTPAWLTDLEVGYQITPRLHAAIGGNNIFNVRPRRVPNENAYLGVAFYDQDSSGIPINGGFYYGRLNVNF